MQTMVKVNLAADAREGLCIAMQDGEHVHDEIAEPLR